MSDVTAAGGDGMADKEIAADILQNVKYLSTCHYAPGILESSDPALRGAFQEAHTGATQAAKDVFDYMHAKGWYRPRSADEEDRTELRKVASGTQEESKWNSIGGPEKNMSYGPQEGWINQPQHHSGQGYFGSSQPHFGQQHYQGQSPYGGQSLYGSQSPYSGHSSYGSQQHFGNQPTNVPMWQTGGSSQSQGQWQGSLPSWTRGGSFGSQQSSPYGSQQSSPYGSQQGSWQGVPWQQSGSESRYGWTGTQFGEGTREHSSLAGSQGWSGGVHSGSPYTHQGQSNLPSWTQGTGSFSGQEGMSQGGMGSYPWQSGQSGWTGTEYGEGLPGYGPSSMISHQGQNRPIR